jgi:hypothetical protein
MAILLSCATLISTGLGGIAAVRFRDRLHLLLGFSAGAVLGVVLFDVLPEIFALPTRSPSVMLGAAAGFLAFLRWNGSPPSTELASTSTSTARITPSSDSSRQEGYASTASSTGSRSASAFRPARRSAC